MKVSLKSTQYNPKVKVMISLIMVHIAFSVHTRCGVSIRLGFYNNFKNIYLMIIVFYADARS